MMQQKLYCKDNFLTQLQEQLPLNLQVELMAKECQIYN